MTSRSCGDVGRVKDCQNNGNCCISWKKVFFLTKVIPFLFHPFVLHRCVAGMIIHRKLRFKWRWIRPSFISTSSHRHQAAQFPPSSLRRLHYVKVYYFNRFILFSYFSSFFFAVHSRSVKRSYCFLFFLLFLWHLFLHQQKQHFL